MVSVNSTMVPLGTPAPLFCLPDASGALWSLEEAPPAPALLVIFLCNHCPYVKHLARELALLAQQFEGRGVTVVGINSNDTDAHPDDAPDRMVEFARAVGWDFPYLVDADQSVARSYRAACTPDFFLFDAERRLAYRGQFDDSRPRNELPATGADLRAAVNAVLAGEPVPEPQRPSMGCNIKWKPGNEPDYVG